MNNGEAYAIFKQIESDKYTDSDKLEAINRVLGAETHNGITKDDLINAFKWFHGIMECYLSEKDMSDRQMQEICSEIDKYSGSGLTPERCAELAQAEREGRLVVLPCNVGDKVWYISNDEMYYGFAEWIDMDKDKLWCVAVTNPPSKYEFVPFDDFGKKAFLTREEAQAALAKEGEK